MGGDERSWDQLNKTKKGAKKTYKPEKKEGEQ